MSCGGDPRRRKLCGACRSTAERSGALRRGAGRAPHCQPQRVLPQPQRQLRRRFHQQRNQAQLRRLLHEAQMPVPKTLADADWGAFLDLDKHQIEQLVHDTGWLDRAKNLLLLGPNGVGKTHLAAGICRSLFALDRSARFYTGTALVQELQRASADYALAKALNRLDRYALLVIDDIGSIRKVEAETSVLFELVVHRYERRSLLVTINQPFSERENVFSTSAMTVAAVDRLVDHSTIIQINGESYRRKRARRFAS